MIDKDLACPVCGARNDPLAVICTNCRGFLQARVDALDLFRTCWGLIESPAATLKRIILARHKNYVLVLSGLFGIALAYGVIWARHLGNSVPDGAFLALGALILGPVLGIAVVLVIALLVQRLAGLAGARPRFRDARAVTAYATMPVICSLIFVFPVELAVFGFNLFGTNPHPMVINPVAYIALIALDVLAAAWASLLFLRGTVMASGAGGGRRVLVGALALLSAAVVLVPLLAA